MFNVFYKNQKMSFPLGKFNTKLEAELFIVNDHESEMIEHAEEGAFDNMNTLEKWKHYEKENSKYSIVEANDLDLIGA